MKDDLRRRDPHAYPWQVAMETRFADMDVNRHLNNVAVSRFFEEARVRFNWHLIADTAIKRPRYLVAHVAIDYLGEGAYPEPVLMTYGVANIGNSSFRCAMGMFQKDGCVALCDSVLVHRGEAGPAPLPADLRTRLEAFALRG